MNKLSEKFRSLFTPVGVMLLVVAVALMTPFASLIGAVRVMAAASTSTPYITNLPARYAKVDEDIITRPTIVGASGATARLYHAGRDITDSITSSTKYGEVGKYEWRFYLSGDTTPFDTYIIWAQQDEYAITMPSVVPTVAPKSLATLKLPLPEKITQDGEDITKEVFAEGSAYTFDVKATMGTNSVTAAVVGDKVEVKLSELDKNQIGDLKVTYLLKKGNRTLAAKVLNDIAIKDVDVSKVTFANNPTAPSVASLKYKEELELTAPTANSAKYDGTSFSVEAETKIIAVKYSIKQPDNWNDVATVDLSNNDRVKVDGLKITALQLGWYKFQFETTTLFGNKTEEDNDEDGKYWSDAVHVSQDSTAPEFKWVAEYTAEDVDGEDGLLARFDDLKESELYTKYLAMSSKPSDSDKATKVTINPNDGIVFPAIIARDNGTAYKDLKYSVSVTQMTDSNWNSLKSTSNSASVSSTVTDKKYDAKETFRIEFKDGITNTTTTDGNHVTMISNGGLYQVTFRVTETQPLYPNGDKGNGYDHPTSKTLYFWVDGSYEVKTPTISSFAVSDVYRWEGNTFEFSIPTYSDSNTPTANIDTQYYLVSGNQYAQLDKSNLNGGRMMVDLDKLTDQDNNAFEPTGEVKIVAVARNFNALQTELKDSANKFEFDPSDMTDGNGIAYQSACFTIHTTASATATAPTFNLSVDDSSSEKITIKSLTANWSKVVDGKISVAAYRIKDGKRTAVQVYNADDEVVSTVLFNKQTPEITNWYFKPDSTATYQIVVTAKENASATSYYHVANYDVTRNGEWEGSTTFSLSPMAVGSVSASTTVGTATTLPGWKGKTADNKSVVLKNRLMYLADANGNITNTTVGDYTITVKGVNDPNCVVGNKFVPNYAGTYKFEYTAYQTGKGAVSLFTYTVTVTDDADTTATMQLDEAYGVDAEGNEVATITDNTNTKVQTAIVLQEFMLANRGGAKNFTVSQDFLCDNLEAVLSDEEDEDGKKKVSHWIYPAIAIPMPNVVNGAVATEDIEITVQKSGSTEYLVSSKKANIDGSNDSKLGKLNGYYVFRPDGKFSTNGENFMTENTYNKNDTGAVYIVTYAMPDGTTTTYNITIGDPVVGSLKFDLANGFLTYKNGKNTVNIDNDNNNPVIEKNSDGKRVVTIDMSKVTYQGNANFIELIREGVTDNKGVTDPDKLAQMYIMENATVSLIKDGTTIINSWSWGDAKDSDAMTYTFELQGSGTYKIEVSLANPYMNSYNAATQSFEFTIDTTATNKNINLNTVWGIILIVLSVGLLAGVIFYFVKTARETRFLDTPKMPKKNKKDAKKVTKEAKVKDEKVEDKQ